MMSQPISRRAALALALSLVPAGVPLAGCVRGSGEVTSTEEYSFEGAGAIELDLSACEVVCHSGDGLQVTVERVNYSEVEVVLDGSTLRITEGKDSGELLSASICKVDITLPADVELDSLVLKVGAGQVLATDIAVRQINIDIEAGEAALDGITTDEATIDVEAGVISIAGLAGAQGANVSLEVEVGEVLFLGSAQGTSYHQDGSGPTLTATVEAGSIEVVA